jgi:hypothetical protein
MLKLVRRRTEIPVNNGRAGKANENENGRPFKRMGDIKQPNQPTKPSRMRRATALSPLQSERLNVHHRTNQRSRQLRRTCRTPIPDMHSDFIARARAQLQQHGASLGGRAGGDDATRCQFE